MRRVDAEFYRHPADASPLRLETPETGASIASGQLVGTDGTVFPIDDGIPDLVYPRVLPDAEAETVRVYGDIADVYDRYIHLTFETFRTTEAAERMKMVDRLRLHPGARVLEFGCGTGRTTAMLADRVGASGSIFLQELSMDVLRKAAEKADRLPVPVSLSRANGSYLPFADNQFDAVFHFGGINMFSDIRRCFAEAARVTKPGGRVVIGDENMPVWLRETEMGRILMNSNRHYACPVPFEHIPVLAREVACEWIIGGVFYVISFTVGEGEPYADLDFPIPGARGGTHRTRYRGQLEGVTPEAKVLAREAAAREKISLHDWLDRVVRDAAGGGR